MNTQEVIEWVDDRLQTTKQRAASGATVTAEIFRYQIEILSSIRARLIAAEKMRDVLDEYRNTDEGKLAKGDLIFFERQRLERAQKAIAAYDAATGETR